MALLAPAQEVESSPRPSTSSAHSLNLSSLQPLSHDHPLLTSTSFSADAFLLSRIHIPLDELRGELREYLGVLREELVQLINDDYEEFISLGTGLRGEEERLRRLEKPLNGLCEEVEGVREILSQQQSLVQSKLDERTALREEKALLDMLQRLFDTLTRAEALLERPDDEDKTKVVARVAGEYTQLVYLVEKARAEGCAIADTIAPRVEAIKSSLTGDLSSLLVSSMQEANQKGLQQCLRTYEVIEGWTEAEEVVRGEVRAFCQATIISSALLVPQSPMVPMTPHPNANPFDKLPESTPLAELYNRVLLQVGSYQPLMEAAEELSDRFDFFSRVIYPEIASAISENLGSVIFAAGRPDELHRHFTTTHTFISHLEALAPSLQAVQTMRNSAAYETFERRWQLPVYFQLRWKEIVGTFEAGLTTPGESGDWALSQSAAAWRALQTCWSQEVYLAELAQRFWRLSLQIVARYGGWLNTTLDGYKISEEDPSQEDAALRLAASAVLDLNDLSKRVKELEVCKALDVADHLAIPLTPFSNKITAILTRRCTDSLKLVRSVASQFRAGPTKSTDTPSYFIPSILKPIHDLFQPRPTLRAQYGAEWSSTIVDQVCVSYAGILGGVLKTEDLMRRYRKSKKGTFSLFGGSSAGGEEVEEEKFRKQMQVDIEALGKDARGLGVVMEGLEGWKELAEVVNRPAE